MDRFNLQSEWTYFGEETFLVEVFELGKGRFELELDFVHVVRV